jgi:hypothetical protein
MTPESLEGHFAEWFKGNEQAVAFATNAWQAAQDWDDLEDEGKTRHNPLLFWLAFGKEYHPYFLLHSGILRPVMMGVALQWSVANVYETEGRSIEKALMLRAGIYGLFHAIALIEGGYDWAEHIGPTIYDMYAETLDDLRKEFPCQSQQ